MHWVFPNTHTGRGIFKCADNMYGKQHKVVQLGAIKKLLLCIFNGRSSSSATDSSIVVGYANFETPDITLDSVIRIKQQIFIGIGSPKAGNWPGAVLSVFSYGEHVSIVTSDSYSWLTDMDPKWFYYYISAVVARLPKGLSCSALWDAFLLNVAVKSGHLC